MRGLLHYRHLKVLCYAQMLTLHKIFVVAHIFLPGPVDRIEQVVKSMDY